MPVTIYDIAEQAGVSIATVSRVFSGRARVAEQTRERVFAIASDLGYEPNVSARSLARQSTQVICAVMPMLASYFFMEVIRGVQDHLADQGYDLLVYASASPDRVDSQFERALQPGRADGLLVCSTPLQAEQVKRLSESGYPVALVDWAHPDFDSVAINNIEGGYAAVRHLLELGRERIALIMPHAESVPGIERRLGAERMLREAGLTLDPAMVVTSTETQRHGYTSDDGYAAMQTLLSRSPRPDAVFASSDEQALGALKAIRGAGLRCPEDIAVIGFDDIRTSGYVGLSTLSQPMAEMGKAAADKLLRRINDPERPVSQTAFSPRLIARETTTGHPEASPSNGSTPPQVHSSI